MKRLLQQPGSHRTVLLIAMAIALGITVHEVFFVVAQILALAACIQVMLATIREQQGRTATAHQHS